MWSSGQLQVHCQPLCGAIIGVKIRSLSWIGVSTLIPMPMLTHVSRNHSKMERRNRAIQTKQKLYMINHNLTLLIEFYHHIHTNQIPQVYKDCLSHTQFKDIICIWQPPKISNLTLNTHECNPDEDINRNKPQSKSMAWKPNLFYHNGNYVATFTAEIIQWLSGRSLGKNRRTTCDKKK
jgi:hypothetical protein